MMTLEILAALFRWEARRLDMERIRAAWRAVGGTSPEAPILEAMVLLFDSYTDTLAELLGAGDWLQWFWIENDGGAKGLQAGYDGDLREIRTLDDLCWLVEQARAR